MSGWRNKHATARVPMAARPPGSGGSKSRRGVFRGMASPNFRLEDLAYGKLLLHALKFPHQTVNGVFIGYTSTSGTVILQDVVPLQHHWTNLSPMMEVGLGMATNYARSCGRQVVGYYQAPEVVGDTTLSPVGECVAAKIKENFQTPIALVLDGSKLDDETGAALVAYLPISSSSTTFRLIPGRDKLRFEWAIAGRALRHVHHSRILDSFWDFDEYLEDNRLPFLTNPGVRTAFTSAELS